MRCCCCCCCIIPRSVAAVAAFPSLLLFFVFPDHSGARHRRLIFLFPSLPLSLSRLSVCSRFLPYTIVCCVLRCPYTSLYCTCALLEVYATDTLLFSSLPSKYIRSECLFLKKKKKKMRTPADTETKRTQTFLLLLLPPLLPLAASSEIPFSGAHCAFVRSFVHSFVCYVTTTTAAAAAASFYFFSLSLFLFFEGMRGAAAGKKAETTTRGVALGRSSRRWSLPGSDKKRLAAFFHCHCHCHPHPLSMQLAAAAAAAALSSR